MKSLSIFKTLLLPVVVSVAGCGGGGGSGGGGPPIRNNNGWQAGVYLPASTFKNRCAVPRPGTPDISGTTTDQNNWLRSWTNDTYLWYSEVTDRDPATYTDPLVYFDQLKTAATTASGRAKDKFHFTYDTDDWIALSQGGISAGYGASFEILAPSPPRRIVVAFVEEDSPAFGVLQRGDEVLQVDGSDAVNGNTQAVVNALNAGLFPDGLNESHTFVVRDIGGAQRTVTLRSEEIFNDPVPMHAVFDSPSGDVGYILFNDHSQPAEAALMAKVATLLDDEDITDLIVDLRYNGGGYLDIASEFAYMIANPTLTSGQTFERLVFNSKHPNTNPITGDSLTPTPFHTRTLFATVSQPLRSLQLGRVYLITGTGTCSASESIINGLRGVGVQVYLIGSTTCGKPYGFYPTDNCGTTFFTIQFRGENDAGFGDYSDGFSPANTTANAGTTVPGCSVADDFTHELGDPAERRIAAALSFRNSNNQTCPAASGFTDPRLSKMSFQNAPDRDLWVSKPAARMNRILRQGS